MSFKNEANNPGLQFDNLLVDPPRAMNILLLHRAKSAKMGALIAPAVIVLGISFSLSSVFGLVVAIAVACGFIASIDRIRSYIERRDLVLVITSTGLRMFVYDKEVEISWQDVEAMKTSHGKTGVFLHLKLAQPEQYVSKFARMNRVLSAYQLSIPISGLELPWRLVAKAIESAWRSKST